jgi:Glyoxalase superfamily protein
VIQVEDIEPLHNEIRGKDYPFTNPGIEPRGIGREVAVLDPAANQIRFFEAGTT